MFTSYYAKCANHPHAIAISAKVPEFYKGKHYPKLAPSWSIFSEWKKSKDNNLYIRRFSSEILDKLNPKQVYEELGDDAVLICYEAKDFCHRHLVAYWLSMSLGINIVEL